MTQTVHVISARPPLRALALGGVGTVVGLGLVLVGTMAAWPAASVLGWALVLVGLGLFVAAWLTARRARVQVVLDDAGYQLDGPDGSDRVEWSEVSRVTRTPDRLVLYAKDGTVTALVAPTSSRADLDAIGTDMARYLDANRGYGG
jgi:hypothetical protein